MAQSELQRDLSLHFGHRFVGGVKYEQVLEALDREINIENIKSIQITEKDCIVTVSESDVKQRLLRVGLTVKEKCVKFYSVEKEITNVTIKDAPYEMSDAAIAGYMSRYGEVVSGSIRHGKVKFRGIAFDNGTRYLQIINCVPILPNATTFGNFTVRIFADNGRTPCLHCGLTDHPSFRCENKRVAQKSCYFCKSEGHIKKDCPEFLRQKEKRCYNCNETGHLRRDCPNFDSENLDSESDGSAHEEYVDSAYMNETIEDRIAAIRSNVDSDITPTHVVLGASNCNRCTFDGDGIVNASISGATLTNIPNVIQSANSQIGEKHVDKVVISSGTNDVTRNKLNPDRISAYATKAVELVKDAFSEAEIGFSTILPRKGSSVHAKELNSTTCAVNTFIRNMCAADESLKLIDAHAAFIKDDVTNVALYDQYDPSGVHINSHGAKCLADTFMNFFAETERNAKKRSRAASSTSSYADGYD